MENNQVPTHGALKAGPVQVTVGHQPQSERDHAESSDESSCNDKMGHGHGIDQHQQAKQGREHDGSSKKNESEEPTPRRSNRISMIASSNKNMGRDKVKFDKTAANQGSMRRSQRLAAKKSKAESGRKGHQAGKKGKAESSRKGHQAGKKSKAQSGRKGHQAGMRGKNSLNKKNN
jgi:hypothetical protein